MTHKKTISIRCFQKYSNNMEVILTNLFRTLLFSLSFSTAWGIILNLMYELTPKKFKVAYTFFKDTLSIVLYLSLFILLLYYFNNGEYRWYYLLAFIGGAFVYKICLSRAISWIVKMLINPLKVISKYIIKIIRKIYCFFVHTIAKFNKKMYNKKVNI